MNLYQAADFAINTQTNAATTYGEAVFHKEVPMCELLPDHLFLPSEEGDENLDDDTDTAWIDGPPAGSGRVPTFADHYQNNGENSPFVLTDEEMADRMVSGFLSGGIDSDSPLGVAIAGMVKELNEEGGEFALLMRGVR